jgi:four helix bundle protein
MHNFKKLRVWNFAMDLTVDIYRLTDKFPAEERFGRTQQIRRATVSIPSNIAEGAYRNSDKEFNHFLGVASGSSGEVYTPLELAKRLGYLQGEEVDSILNSVDSTQKMLSKLQLSLGT